MIIGKNGKMYRYSYVKKSEIKVKILLEMANSRDFPPIFCQTAEFLPGCYSFQYVVLTCNMDNDKI